MKTVFKKILICILIIMMINNFFISNLSIAGYEDSPQFDWLEAILGTVVGLLTWPFRIVALGAAIVVDMLVARSRIFRRKSRLPRKCV